MELRRRPSRIIPCSGFGTGFSNLPPEILTRIFDYMSPRQRQSLREVCTRWNSLIESHYDIELHFINSTYKHAPNTKARFIIGTVSDLCFKFDHYNCPDFSSRLLKLEFAGINLPLNYYNILRGSHCLKELSLDQVKLLNGGVWLQEAPRLVRAWLPALRVLRFTFHEDEDEEESQLRLLEFLSNVLEVGRLERLYIKASNERLDLKFPLELLHGGPEAPEVPGPPEGFKYCLGKILRANERTVRLLSLDIPTSYSTKKTRVALELTEPSGGKFGLKRFKGVGSFLRLPDVPWIPVLAAQENRLVELDIEFRELEMFSQDMFREMETVTSDIILKNCGTLVDITIVCTVLPFAGHLGLHYAGVFGRCMALKSLTLIHIPLLWHVAFTTPENLPSFSGLEHLPPSLTHFTTTLSLTSHMGGVRELQLGNLRSLESLDWRANPWFVFNGIPYSKLSIQDYNALRQKLPGLKSLLLRIETIPTLSLDGVRKTSLALTNGLVEKLRKFIEVDEEEGLLFLKINP